MHEHQRRLVLPYDYGSSALVCLVPISLKKSS
jgi:hypothetical protein